MQTILMLLGVFFVCFLWVFYFFYFFSFRKIWKKTEKMEYTPIEIQRLINAKFTGMVVDVVCVWQTWPPITNKKLE